jgi:hypothetical protein
MDATLTIEELKVIAYIMSRITKYPSTATFIDEVYYGILFREISERFGVNRQLIKQKLETIQTKHPQQFKIFFDKMHYCWRLEIKDDELVPQLAELKLI